MGIYTFLSMLIYLYLGIGVVFGIWFVAKGVDSLDELMPESGWLTRLMFFPGAVGLWVILLVKCLNARKHGT